MKKTILIFVALIIVITCFCVQSNALMVNGISIDPWWYEIYGCSGPHNFWKDLYYHDSQSTVFFYRMPWQLPADLTGWVASTGWYTEDEEFIDRIAMLEGMLDAGQLDNLPEEATDEEINALINSALFEFYATNPEAYSNPTGVSTIGDPVFTSNGEYGISAADIAIAGRVLPVQITRTYGSRREYNSRFGYGWDMNYNMKVRKTVDPNLIIFLDGKSGRNEYARNNNDPNMYIRQEDWSQYFYLNTATGCFALIKKSGIEYHFDINGNLSSIKDENGNQVQFAYDSGGLLPIYGRSDYFLSEDYGGPANKYGLVAMEYKLTTITDDLERNINLYYDSNGLLTDVNDFSGRNWHYAYDPCTNDLLTVRDPAGNITTYTYGTDKEHNLISIIDPNGNTYLTNHYNADDKVYEQMYGYGTYTFDYNTSSYSAFLMNREGHISKIVYTPSGQMSSETIYTDDPNSEPNSFTTRYFYDSNTLELVRQILPDGNSCVDYTYDDLANVTGIYRKTNVNEPNDANDPNVIATTYTYDSVHIYDVNTVTDAMGNVTTYTYDGNGNLTTIAYPAVNTPNGSRTPIATFTYNQYGRIDESNSVDGIITKYLYYTNANDVNNYGHLWKTIADYSLTDANALNITTEYKYDVLGRVVETIDANGNNAKSVYNELDQVIRSISPLNYAMSFSYNQNKKLAQLENEIAGPNQITSYTYNLLDKVKTVKDPLGFITRSSYDAEENLSDVNDAEENNTHYDYDERGLVCSVADANGNITLYDYTLNGTLAKITDANSNETIYTYDGFGRLICTAYPDNTTETFAYDKNSNLLSFTNRAGQTTSYQYDALNRQISKSLPSEPNIMYIYDIAGRLWDVNDRGDITEFYYDRLGRITEVLNPQNKTVGYDYDILGRQTKLTYPDDTNVTYEYDALSRLTKVKYQGETIAEYQYDELSRRKLVTYGNDANIVYDYDLGNRLTRITNNADACSIDIQYSEYDNVGNRLNMVVNGKEDQYSYDEIYRLISVDYNDGNNTEYVYDCLSNWVDVDDGSPISFLHNRLNQYTSVAGVNYSYDLNGNLTNDGTYKYYYDCENHLTDVNTAANDSLVAHYVYDYLGRRVSKTDYTLSPIRSTLYYYDGDQIIAEYDGTGNLLRKFIYGPGIDEPIMMIDASTANRYYYHYDGLGSVAALSNNDGEIVETYSYDAFGMPNRTSSVGNTYLFTGRQYDSETGNYYYRARFYLPQIGRFLQTDALGYHDSLNLYEYCDNNPINFIDPSGKILETAWDIANVGIGTVSLVSNVRKGNYGWATVDAIGLLYDSVATAVPFLPGGAGAALKAARAGNTIAKSIDVGIDVARIAKQTDRVASVADTTSSAMSYGRNVHNAFKNMPLKAIDNFAPSGRANRATGIRPDFQGIGIWADITTAGQWQRHVDKYSDIFGTGIPILYERGKGVTNMWQLHIGAGIGLAGTQAVSSGCK